MERNIETQPVAGADLRAPVDASVSDEALLRAAGHGMAQPTQGGGGCNVTIPPGYCRH